MTDVPDEGILSSGVPAALGALVKVLARFGRLTFAEVVEPALEYARNGFPVHAGLYGQERFGIRDLEEKFRNQWPGSAQVYLPHGMVPEVGKVLVNSALADLLDYLKTMEQSLSGNREKGLEAVLEAFYRGDPATEIEYLLYRNTMDCLHVRIWSDSKRILKNQSLSNLQIPWFSNVDRGIRAR